MDRDDHQSGLKCACRFFKPRFQVLNGEVLVVWVTLLLLVVSHSLWKLSGAGDIVSSATRSHDRGLCPTLAFV